MAKDLRIKYDFGHGPVWKEKYDVNTGKISTGIETVDNDETLMLLNEIAEKEYSSLYSFDSDGSFRFDEKAYKEKKAFLLSLIQTIILRLNYINDGSFNVIDEETPKLMEL